eukprot:TRINITY_DN50930_c0_g1_i1.p1 TRINITY_DN50930_c0_g1~~TRINITY_DN50930_c0_g1_i1.p1  ORF type:complete len:245 (+),score=33.75 TRINITY_DN50930_c0_g1_i1:54-788(+)
MMREAPALPLYEMSVSHDALVSSEISPGDDVQKRGRSWLRVSLPPLRKLGALLLTFVLGGLLWKLGLSSVFGAVDVDVASYEVLKKTDSYEIRRYAASTAVATSGGAQNGAFMRLAGFIGVMGEAQNARHQKIAMTAPVVTVNGASGEEMQFILPSEVNGSAPEPTSKGVHLVARPSAIFGVETFSGSWAASEFDRRAKALEVKLNADGYKVEEGAAVQHMRYNPPWTIPIFRTNEVAVQLHNV